MDRPLLPTAAWQRVLDAYVLGRLTPSEEYRAGAHRALEAGITTPAFLELAGLYDDQLDVARSLFDRALCEAEVVLPAAADAQGRFFVPTCRAYLAGALSATEACAKAYALYSVTHLLAPEDFVVFVYWDDEFAERSFSERVAIERELRDSAALLIAAYGAG